MPGRSTPPAAPVTAYEDGPGRQRRRVTWTAQKDTAAYGQQPRTLRRPTWAHCRLAALRLILAVSRPSAVGRVPDRSGRRLRARDPTSLCQCSSPRPLTASRRCASDGGGEALESVGRGDAKAARRLCPVARHQAPIIRLCDCRQPRSPGGLARGTVPRLGRPPSPVLYRRVLDPAAAHRRHDLRDERGLRDGHLVLRRRAGRAGPHYAGRSLRHGFHRLHGIPRPRGRVPTSITHRPLPTEA